MIKVAIALLIILLNSEISYASRGYTVAGHLACGKQGWLFEFQEFAMNKDRYKLLDYIKEKKCTILKGDLPVIITDYPGLFGTTTGFLTSSL